MERVRVGVIGLGEVAQIIHLPILQALDDRFEIAAVCDVSPGLLRVIGDRVSGRPSLSPMRWQLTQLPDLDAVFVLNSDEYHADCVIAAANAGEARPGREADVPDDGRGGGDHPGARRGRACR